MPSAGDVQAGEGTGTLPPWKAQDIGAIQGQPARVSCHQGLCGGGTSWMNSTQWGLPAAGRVAAPGGGRRCPEEGVELGSIPLRHARGLPVGSLGSGAKERLVAVRWSVADQPVSVLLPWHEGWGAALRRGGPTALLAWQALQPSGGHSFGSVSLLHPGWVKVWEGGPGAHRAAKQSLINIRFPGLGPAAVLKVKGLHSTDGLLHGGLHAACGRGWQWRRSVCQASSPGLPRALSFTSIVSFNPQQTREVALTISILWIANRRLQKVQS